jgi:hypothetical protein
MGLVSSMILIIGLQSRMVNRGESKGSVVRKDGERTDKSKNSVPQQLDASMGSRSLK